MFGIGVQLPCLLTCGDSVSYPTPFRLLCRHRSLHRDRLNRVPFPRGFPRATEHISYIYSADFQASADVRVRVTEVVVRVRVRDSAVSAIIGVTTHVQQLHGLSPFRTALKGRTSCIIVLDVVETRHRTARMLYCVRETRFLPAISSCQRTIRKTALRLCSLVIFLVYTKC